MTLRQLLPANRILACEPDADRRAVALRAWCRTGDELSTDLPALPPRLAGLVVMPSADAALIERLLAGVDPAAIPAVIVPVLQAEFWKGRMGGRAALTVHGDLVVLAAPAVGCGPAANGQAVSTTP